MKNYKINNGVILSFRDDMIVTEPRTLYVREGKITFSPFGENESYETVDASRRLIMPGLINMHTHVYMTLMRNYADDVPFQEWLFDRVMPVEDNLPREAAYWTSMLGYLEMISTGTTCFVDMHMYHRQPPLAARDAGIRAYIGRGLVGDELYEGSGSRFSQALEEKEEFESDTLKFMLAPHAIYTCSPLFLQQVAEEAGTRGMLKEIHLSESVTEVEDCLKNYGKTPVQFLSDLGFLDENTILAHCVQMRGNDLDILKASGASVVTNVASNAKLGNGIAPVSRMKEMGINVCIGTDGAASNNTLNMFREMGLLSLMHKACTRDCLAIPSDYIVKAATFNAARALKNPALGNIIEGAAADLIFIDLDAPSLFPNNNLSSA
ncbi:MAG: amidohydrolase, partial [Eubacterium sp.]|nr:amidohydrolase [Eubacterium sp.]